MWTLSRSVGWHSQGGCLPGNLHTSMSVTMVRRSPWQKQPLRFIRPPVLRLGGHLRAQDHACSAAPALALQEVTHWKVGLGGSAQGAGLIGSPGSRGTHRNLRGTTLPPARLTLVGARAVH